MAGKKGSQVQLQTELNNNEEWNEFLERKGLLVIDVYSDWCGSCTAMVGYLKKVKLEVGADNLHLAIAKSDNITCLQRFQSVSEPTWLFVSKKKMVNLLFGSNVPKLLQTIAHEMQLEAEAENGNDSRILQEIDQLTPLELAKEEVKIKKRAEMEAIEKAENERQTAENHEIIFSKIAKTLINITVVYIWPQMQEMASILTDVWDHHKLSISHIDRPILNNEKIEKWIQYCGFEVSPIALKLLTEGKSLVWLLKSDTELDEPIEDYVARAIYGESMQPPGDPGSPGEKFVQHHLLTPEEIKQRKEHMKKTQPKDSGGSPHLISQNTQTDENMEECEQPAETTDMEFEVLSGIWTPRTPIAKATVTHTIFPKITTALLNPEPETIPPHILMMFEAFKKKEVLETIQDFPDEVLHYGFFTCSCPQDAQLVAKTVDEFNQLQNINYDEKLALAVVKIRLHPIEVLSALGAIYTSENFVVGIKECAILFPEDYEPKPQEPVDETSNHSGDENENDEEMIENGDGVAAPLDGSVEQH